MNWGVIIRSVVGFFVVLAAPLVLVVEASILVDTLGDSERLREAIPRREAAFQTAKEREKEVYAQHPELRDYDSMLGVIDRCNEDLKSLQEDHPAVAARVKTELVEGYEKNRVSEGEAGTADEQIQPD